MVACFSSLTPPKRGGVLLVAFFSAFAAPHHRRKGGKHYVHKTSPEARKSRAWVRGTAARQRREGRHAMLWANTSYGQTQAMSKHKLWANTREERHAMLWAPQTRHVMLKNLKNRNNKKTPAKDPKEGRKMAAKARHPLDLCSQCSHTRKGSRDGGQKALALRYAGALPTRRARGQSAHNHVSPGPRGLGEGDEAPPGKAAHA